MSIYDSNGYDDSYAGNDSGWIYPAPTPSGPKPFIDNLAFNKRTLGYDAFTAQSDAMLASLLLFHQVPSHIMDFVISIVTHPEFDPDQVTLRHSKDVLRTVKESQRKKRIIVEGVRAHRRSLDVIGTAEQLRMQERMAVVHARSQPRSQTRCYQAGIPHFVLDEVLEIIKADRQAKIDASFEKPWNVGACEIELEEDVLLSNMSLVHRFWTFPAQKALGQVVWINTNMDNLHYRRRAVEGPWSSVVAITLTEQVDGHHSGAYFQADIDCGTDLYDYYPSYTESEPECCTHMLTCTRCEERHIENRERQRIENEKSLRFDFLHCFLLSLPNLKRVYIKSDDVDSISRFNVTVEGMVRQNTQLEELTLYSCASDQDSRRDSRPDLHDSFNLDFLLESEASINLKSLTLRGGSFSDAVRDNKTHDTSFANLRSFSIFDSNTELLSILSAQRSPLLKFISITSDDRPGSRYTSVVTPIQFGTIFEHIRTLRIDHQRADDWIKSISPHCPSLEDLSIRMGWCSRPDLLDSLPTSIRRLGLHFSKEVKPISLYCNPADFKTDLDLWLDYLPFLPFSGNLPWIESLTLRSEKCFTGHLALEDYDSLVDRFHDKMKPLFRDKGIVYNSHIEPINRL